MAKDIAMGMNWLHELGICHLDLKPKNILMDRHGTLKVADFGYSRLLQSTNRLGLFQEENLGMGGSPIYMAPERLESSKNFRKGSDVYSFAIMFWEILTGEMPYQGHDVLAEFKKSIIRDKERPALSRIVEVCGGEVVKNVDLLTLLTQMWDADISLRPPFSDILKRLDTILICSAVSDDKAQAFWKSYFCRSSTMKSKDKPNVEELQTEVSWDVFEKALLEILKPSLGHLSGYVTSLSEVPSQKWISDLGDKPTEDEVKRGTPNALNIYKLKNGEALRAVKKEEQRRILVGKVMRLKKLLIEGYANSVHVSRFGKICDILGPWVISAKGGILENITLLMKHRWFYGYLSKSEAFNYLKNKKEGTFLVRFGRSQSCFVISRVVSDHTETQYSEKRICHYRVKFDSSSGFSLPGKSNWKTIEELIEGEKAILVEAYAPEHPLSSFASEDQFFGDEMATDATNYTESDEMEEFRANHNFNKKL